MAANTTKAPAAEDGRLPAARPVRPNYNLLHRNPLPLKIDALPPLIPHNPLSLVAIACAYLLSVLRPAKQPNFVGYFSPETRSVHVTDPVAVRALWESGFFGKGTLSRSEPTWLAREKARRGIAKGETSEDVTRRRRQERAQFKKERARKEREEIEATLRREREGHTPDPNVASPQPNGVAVESTPVIQDNVVAPAGTENTGRKAVPSSNVKFQDGEGSLHDGEEDVADVEHLQLTLEETLFLVFALGVLDIVFPGKEGGTCNQPVQREQIFSMLQAHAAFAPINGIATPSSTRTFLANYAVYHHFRSLGWIVRPGTKFAVDWMLYNRGPVFSHAEFAVITMPSPAELECDSADAPMSRHKNKSWHWLHMVNRVQSQVRKTLVLAFVALPSDISMAHLDDPTTILSTIRVREIILKRWIPNRNRD